MDKVGDLFDKITPMVEAMDFDKENAAVLLLGADFDHECATYQGSVKSLVALLISAMENKDELSFVVLKAAEIFLERRKRGEGLIKKEERRYPTWENDLIMCPSQCYCYFESAGKRYCIYLRWRNCDPWTAQIVPVDNDWMFIYDVEWEYLDIDFYSHDRYGALQKKCVQAIKKRFEKVKWLVKEHYGE